MSVWTSQQPSAVTPPQGPLRSRFAQFMGHAMPVAESTHCPHIRQSKRIPFDLLSTAANKRSERFRPSKESPARSNGKTRQKPL
jgi:hypothetical protein